MTVVCVNEQCDQYQIPKDVSVTLAPGESVRCGGWAGQGQDRAPCQQPCQEQPPEAAPR